MSSPRNHRLRERRLKLGASQFLVGCLADVATGSAQAFVSNVERGKATPRNVERVRRALIWLETEPRRKREAARQEARALAEVEASMPAPFLPVNRKVLIDRLVDLLWDGRTEEFDALADRLPSDFAKWAGDIYLDGIKPNV